LKGLKKLNTVEGVEEVEGVEDYHVFINEAVSKGQPFFIKVIHRCR
jgi:hypothetical protein